jgi:glycosyltransferase involved in cell wall biosynthesis
MNIGNLGAPNGGRPFPYGRTRRFLFIGHIRREKGIERLLDAWLQFVNGKDDVELVVAGTIAYKIDFDLDRLRSARVTWISGYIGDEEYANFIKASDCVVFPYIRGTNSGVLSNVASAGVLMVASNIPMFSQSGLVPDACMFNGNDSFGLRSKLEEFYNMAQERRSAIIAEIRRMAAERSSDFERGLLGLVADCT